MAGKSTKPSPGTVKTPSSTACMKLSSVARALSSTSLRASLQWTWTTRPTWRFSRAIGIAAGENAVAAIVEEADRLAGRRPSAGRSPSSVSTMRAHVMVEGHADAEFGHALGELRQAAAIVAASRRRRALDACEIGAKRSPDERWEVSA